MVCEFWKKARAIWEWWLRRRRVWWIRGGESVIPERWREDSRLWWQIRIWERESASGEGRSGGREMEECGGDWSESERE